MWTHSTSIDTIASPQALWRLFEDVAGWTRWNAGIERIALDGPFATGSTFDMQPPGMEAFTSTLRDVRPEAGFVDETVLEDTRYAGVVLSREEVRHRSRGPPRSNVV